MRRADKGNLYMSDEQRIKRRQVVRGAILLTQNTPLAPSLPERHLLAQFVRGSLTIDQVLALVGRGIPAEVAPGGLELGND
jgi:hypothetical protein